MLINKSLFHNGLQDSVKISGFLSSLRLPGLASDRRLRSVCALLVLAATISIARAQTIPLKAVFYRPTKASFWAELADDSGSSPTPREYVLSTIDQNFSGIAANTHATAVVVYLPDEDDWQSQYGGGFSYDPYYRGKPQFGVAQELLVSVAAKYNLKVIFQINFSTYHMSNTSAGTDLYGNGGDPADYPGAYAFIHALIGPASYYGNLPTTKLSTVGLTDHTIHDFIGDSRIAAWYMGGEWVMQVPAQAQFFVKYWPWFYSLVHYGGASNQMAAVYPTGWPVTSPDDPSCSTARLSQDRSGQPPGSAGNYSPFNSIEYLKNLFTTYPTMPKPDLWGIEWYGTSNGLNPGPPNGYRTTCIFSDVQAMVRHMRDYSYTVPVTSIGLHEGGTDYAINPYTGQIYDSYADQFYVDAVNAAANVDGATVAQFAVWNADGDMNKGACSTGDDYPLSSSLDQSFQTFSALYINAAIAGGGCKTYSPDPTYGWHSGATVYFTSFPTQYGYLYYTNSASKGFSVASAFAAH